MWPKTLVDYPHLLRQAKVRKEDDNVGQTEVFAPCCGRRTAAFTVVALHGLETIIRGGNHQTPRNHDWACDGCLHILILNQDNDWTWSKLYGALGAPEDIVHHYKATELAHEEEMAHHKSEAHLSIAERKGFNPQHAYEKHLANLKGVKNVSI